MAENRQGTSDSIKAQIEALLSLDFSDATTEIESNFMIARGQMITLLSMRAKTLEQEINDGLQNKDGCRETRST